MLGRRVYAACAVCSAVLHGISLGHVSNVMAALLMMVMVIGCLYCARDIWLRGTLPRFRFDQLMSFGWKFLVPAAIVNIVITATIEWSGLFDLVARYIKTPVGWGG